MTTALTTKDNVKALLGGQFDAGTDALLDQLCAAASAYIVGKIGYDPGKADVTDTLDGHGGDAIPLSCPYVNTVTTVTINDVAVPVSTASAVSGYVADMEVGILYLRGYCAYRGRRNIVVSYNAGFDPIPADLTMAATELAALRYKVRSNIGIQSRTLANETIVYTDKDATAFTKQVIAQWQRPVAP